MNLAKLRFPLVDALIASVSARLVLRDKEMANRYAAEWEKHRGHSKPYAGR